MAAETSDTGLWQQIGVFLGIGAAALTAAINSYRQGHKEAEPPAQKHVVLEQAEIADVNIFRNLLQRYDAGLELEADVREMKEKDAEILAILRKMERQEELRSLLREREHRERDRDRKRDAERD